MFILITIFVLYFFNLSALLVFVRTVQLLCLYFSPVDALLVPGTSFIVQHFQH